MEFGVPEEWFGNLWVLFGNGENTFLGLLENLKTKILRFEEF
jgi:hypothetical protein